MSKTYSEKLRDPRWQKKRLEILERDGWHCQICSSETKTLHVHHLYYAESGNPWDVIDSGLISLCEDCHKGEEEEKKEAQKHILDALGMCGCTVFDLQRIGNIIFNISLYEGRNAANMVYKSILKEHDPNRFNYEKENNL